MAWETSDRRSRLPADWPQRRVTVLRRDGYRCQMGYPGCSIKATDVDHIVPGDDHSLPNLRAACSNCHAKKSSREGNTAQARIRALRRRPPEPHPGDVPRVRPTDRNDHTGRSA